MEVFIALLMTLFVVFGGLLVAAVGLAKNLLHICEPNEVLIFSGGLASEEGYRVIKGGRGWRIPLIEKVDRIDLTNMIIDVSVHGAYSSGGIPLNVQGVANVKIGGHDPWLGFAVERLLGKDREMVMSMAKEVLEGNLRGVLSRLTPEEVNEDKLAFAESLQEEAHDDLAKLGLVLDTMKVQNVADDRGYLDSIGRRQSAEIIKKSRVAEARAKATAIIRDASNRQRARLKEISSDVEIARAQAARRVADAETRATAMIAEQRGRVESEIARATGAVQAEEARVEQVRIQLEADVIEPASAEMEAGIASAKGNSAKILEEGRSTVKVLDEMVGVWKSAGTNARDIFLMQKFHAVMGALVDTVGTIQVDKITMLPGGSGGGDDTATRAVRLVEELRGAIGVDLPKLLTDAAGSRRSDD